MVDDVMLNKAQLAIVRNKIKIVNKQAESIRKPLQKAVKNNAIGRITADKIENKVDDAANALGDALIGYRGFIHNESKYIKPNQVEIKDARKKFKDILFEAREIAKTPVEIF